MTPDRITAVVLAGGFGTRVRHLLPGIPKPMAQVGGRPFLEWVVRYLARQGIAQVVLSTGHLSPVIERYFQAQPVPGVTTQCAVEEEPLGTAGGFLNAVEKAGGAREAWLVLNGDSLAFADLATAATDLDDAATAGVLIGCPVPDASRYGTLAIGTQGELLGFREKRPGQGVINAGMYLFRDSLVRQFPAQRPLSFENDVFPVLAERRVPLRVRVIEAPFLDIGTPETLMLAQAFVQGNRAQFLE